MMRVILCLWFVSLISDAQKFDRSIDVVPEGCEDLMCTDPFTSCKLDGEGRPGCFKRCQSCDGKVKEKHVCGGDANTYLSLCHLEEAECILDKQIGFACNGHCPCDPDEVYELDPDTVMALNSLRRQVQLDEYLLQNEQGADRAILQDDADITFEILEKDIPEEDTFDKETVPSKKPLTVKMDAKKMLNVDTSKIMKNITKTKPQEFKPTVLCPLVEMRSLPGRLVDWFHVLKTNEKRRMFTEMNMPTKHILTEMSFMEAKLKSLYSQLACKLQEDDGQEICFTPVKWMFEHLDEDNDAILSAAELYEIEEINSEHCIKPFLEHCDSNKDGNVKLKEFCKCLCVEPPCTKIMRLVPANITNGQPVAATNHTFSPKCDEDGFFMPTQCHLDECWCVDRNGAEYIGTRKKNGRPECEDNTELHAMKLQTRPLDYKTENSRLAKK